MADMNTMPTYPGWTTVRRIGAGSFGAVYEIERDLFGKKEKAALKVMSIPQNESDVDELYGSGYDDASITAHFEGFLADIVREYSLMAEMKGHTNVVYCDDIRYIQKSEGFGWDIYIKMELLTPLMKALTGDASDEQVIQIGKDICKALVLCRSRNIVHRDIKPQNIFVSKDGDYKLGDFGIAKTVERTSGGTKIGTYNYMAPEVYNNQPYGHSADIYSLGLVLYWLLNERRMPFVPLPPAIPRTSEIDEARQHRFHGEPLPAPAHGSEELKRIVLKACAFDPKDRYQSAEKMLSDFDAFAGNGRNNLQDRFTHEQDSLTPAAITFDAKDGKSGNGEPQTTDNTDEDATVSALHQEPHIDIDEETIGVFAGDRPQIVTPKAEKKRSIIPTLLAIAAVLVIASVLFFQRSWQSEPPESETSIVEDTSHLSEVQLREIPEWCYDDSVTIKGNQICFSRQDGLLSDDIYIKFIFVFTYDNRGQLYDMRCFDLYPTVEMAEKWYNESINYNYDGEKNCHGYTQEDGTSYFCMGSTLVEVYDDRYYTGSQEATFDAAVEYWAGLGWTINRVDSDDTSVLLVSDPISKTTPLAELQVGAYVCFGSYEQDNNSANGKEDIEWLVLAKEGNRVLLISRYALDYQQYNTSDTGVTW